MTKSGINTSLSLPRKWFHWGRVKTSSSNRVRLSRAERRYRRTSEPDTDAASPTEMLLNRETEPGAAVGRIPSRSSSSSSAAVQLFLGSISSAPVVNVFCPGPCTIHNYTYIKYINSAVVAAHRADLGHAVIATSSFFPPSFLLLLPTLIITATSCPRDLTLTSLR